MVVYPTYYSIMRHWTLRRAKSLGPIADPGIGRDRHAHSPTRFEELQVELSSQKQGTSILILSAPGDLQRTLLETIATLNERANGKILLFNGTMSSRSISESFEEKGVSTKNLHFLDLISGLAGGSPTQTDSYTVLPSHSGLTQVLIQIGKCLELTGSQVFVLDSVGTLPIYFERASVIKFVHLLVTKLKARGVTAVILSPKEERDNMKEKIAPFFNAIIDLVGPTLQERVDRLYGR